MTSLFLPAVLAKSSALLAIGFPGSQGGGFSTKRLREDSALVHAHLLSRGVASAKAAIGRSGP